MGSASVGQAGLPAPDYVISLTHTEHHFDQIVELIAPQGKFGLIDDPAPIDVRKFKRKAVSLHWELMFTRPLFTTPDLARQGELLAEVAALDAIVTARGDISHLGDRRPGAYPLGQEAIPYALTQTGRTAVA